MTAPKTPVSRAEMALAEVKEATRELNAAIAEAREAKRLLDVAVAEVNDLAQEWRTTYEKQLRSEYNTGVENYATHLKAVMDSHSAAVIARLDKLISAITNPFNSPYGYKNFEQIILGDHAPPPSPPPKMAPRTGKRRR